MSFVLSLRYPWCVKIDFEEDNLGLEPSDKSSGDACKYQLQSFYQGKWSIFIPLVVVRTWDSREIVPLL